MREIDAEVLVIGAGPAGIAAAVAAAERGKRVALLDENPAPGGQIWRRGVHAAPPRAHAWIERLRVSGADVRAGIAVSDADPATRTLWAEDAQGLLRCRGAQLVLATGARELFLPFPGWTLPGVLGAGGLQALAKSGYDVRGKKIGIAGSGPLLWAVAAWLAAHGAGVAFLAEQAPRARLLAFAAGALSRPSKLAQLAGLRWKLRGVPELFSSWPIRALGRERIEAVELRTARGIRAFDVDALGVGFGLIPESGLAELLGCAIDADERVEVDPLQRTSVAGVFAAGEPTGIAGVECALLEGEIAGACAAGDAAGARRMIGRRDRERRYGRALERAFALRPELRSLPEDDTIVCRCEDARWGQLEDLGTTREAKLFARCGMGPCQGRVCHPALRFLTGGGPDRRRPPLLPLTLGALSEISAAAATTLSEAPR